MITPFDRLITVNKLVIMNLRVFEEQLDPSDTDKVRVITVFCSTQISKVFAFKLMIKV